MKALFKSLKERDILTKEHMGKVQGGQTGTCGFAVWTGDSYIVSCGVPKADAQDMVAHFTGHGNWCCDSCASTWYCKDQ